MPACAARNPALGREISFHEQRTLHLAHRVAWELLDLHHALGTFVGREPFMCEGDDLLLVQRPPARRHDECRDLLAPSIARHARDRDLMHGGVLLEYELHLARVDVEAAGDDELLDAAADGQAAVLADLAHVACAEPAVGGVGDDDAALGDAVALDRWLSEQARAALEQRGRQRRRAGYEDTDVRKI